MLSQTGPGLTAELRHGQWGPWTQLNQGSSDGAHGCGLMRHCREDCTGDGTDPKHGCACAAGATKLVQGTARDGRAGAGLTQGTSGNGGQARARVRQVVTGGSAGCEQGEGTAMAQVARARQREVRWLGVGVSNVLGWVK